MPTVVPQFVGCQLLPQAVDPLSHGTAYPRAWELSYTTTLVKSCYVAGWAWELSYTTTLVKSCYVAGRVEELLLFPLLFSGKVKKPGDNYCCAYSFRHTIPITAKCLTLDK